MKGCQETSYSEHVRAVCRPEITRRLKLFVENFQDFKRSRKRPFSHFEQYAGLESRNGPFGPFCSDQACRGRVPEGPEPWDPQGVPGGYPVLGAESRHLAVPGVPAVPGRNCPECRLGPPDPAGIPGTHAFRPKGQKDGFCTT